MALGVCRRTPRVPVYPGGEEAWVNPSPAGMLHSSTAWGQTEAVGGDTSSLASTARRARGAPAAPSLGPQLSAGATWLLHGSQHGSRYLGSEASHGCRAGAGGTPGRQSEPLPSAPGQCRNRQVSVAENEASDTTEQTAMALDPFLWPETALPASAPTNPALLSREVLLVGWFVYGYSYTC